MLGILNIIIKNAYNNLINIKQENKIYDIELPLFLSTGDAVDIQLVEEDETYLLKNTLYKLLENALIEKINIQTLRKEYFFNDKKFIALRKQMLDEKIELNLLLEKRIPKKIPINELQMELFKYIYRVVRYYNYLYDSIIENLNYENQVKIFKDEIDRFIKIFNNRNENNKFNIIDKMEFDMISTYNIYYKNNDKIITAINSKIHLLEALMDIEKIKEKEMGTVIFLDKRKKTDVTETYIEKMLKDNKKLKIYPLKEINELQDENYILKLTEE